MKNDSNILKDCSGAAFFPVCYFGQTFIDVQSITVYLHQPCNLVISPSISNYACMVLFLFSLRSFFILHIILTDGPRRWDMRVIIILASHCFPRKYLGKISKTNIEGFIINIHEYSAFFSIVNCELSMKEEGWLIAKIKRAWHTSDSWISFRVFSN